MDDEQLFRHWLDDNPPRPHEKGDLPPSRSLIRGRKTRLPKKSAPARLDLHGHTVAAAEDLVNQFLRRARLAGARQVIIITGKGMHSDKPGGILKSSIARFLDAGKAGEIRGWRRGNPHEGGDGSIIVDL